VDDTSGRISRRRFVQGAAAAGAAASLGAAAADAEAKKRRRRTKRKRPDTTNTVAVLGGGVAGLTAAHELIDRGFKVNVYEPKALGGKARSMPVPKTAKGGRKELPGEHGFRFFPGFYQHIPDTMRRIPDGSNPRGVFDNLTATSQTVFSRGGGRSDLVVPPTPGPWTPAQAQEVTIAAFEHGGRIPPHELAYFARQLYIYMTSSDERRLGQWDHTSWWDFIGAANFSHEYRQMLAIGVTRNLVAAKAEVASTRTIGAMAEAFLYTHNRSGSGEPPARLLDAPTNEAWIDPWVALLKKKGVRFHLGKEIIGLQMKRGRVAFAMARQRGNTARVSADWFVSAMPVERAVKLLSPAVLRADPGLRGTNELVTDWMNGIQFYLRERVPIAQGHLSYVDSPFALTSISQAQFWHERDFAREYGDGQVRDCLSVDISNWHDNGILYGKPAKELRPHEIAREVWEQIKAHLNDTGRQELRDDMLHSWFLDPAISYHHKRLPAPKQKRRKGRRRRRRATGRRGPLGPFTTQNSEPLLINTVGAWGKRPDAATRIPNLFLSADYVRTNIDLATMEGANESAREAVNQLLEATGSRETPCRKYELYRPPEFEDQKRVDAERYRRGEPHAMQTPYPGT
jgi:uncharacterized protein with NAD-binding domain and iron-sulfur cluster